MIPPVVDIDRRFLAELNLHDQGATASDQRAAGLTHQNAIIRQTDPSNAVLHRIQEIRQRGRLLAEIGRRETTAHVQIVEGHTGGRGDPARQQDPFPKRLRAEALRPDVEGQPGTASRLADLAQQIGGFVGGRTEFLGQLVPSGTAGRGEPHQNRKVFGIVCLIQNLRKFVRMVDDEMPDPINRMRGQNCIPRFDRMHVVCGRVGRETADGGDLRYRGRIEMFDPGLEERAQDEGMRVALHRIQRAAGKTGQELPCGLAQRVRMKAIDGIFRLQHGNHGIGGFESA